MVALGVSRLKREQWNRTKHDSNFSNWKILIGPCDWEDYSKGKEGCERYRIHNLPKKWGAGVYELGIAVPVSVWGSEIYKLDPDRIVVVYLGQAENVRARLQHYGRTGAHLDSNNNHSSPLFHQIFSLGFPIVYRWAPMRNKEDALRTEAQLLTTFDYAWNTSNNGTRRPHDILQKLNKIASGTRTFSDLARALLPISLTHRQVGIRIKSSKLPLADDKLDEADNGSYNNFLSRVFYFNRSRPRVIQEKPGITQDRENAKICGVALGDGSICKRPPAEKRVRCPEHKGMRINASTAKAPKSKNTVVLEPEVNCQTKGNIHRYQNVSHDVQDPPQTVCGIILNDGSTCRREPVQGRKRCHEHKGMRIRASVHVNQK